MTDDQPTPTPLDAALELDDERFLETLLATPGSDPPGPAALDPRDPALLVRSVDFDAAGCVALLLSRGADPDARDGDARRPIEAAAGLPDTACLRLLLDQGANPNARTALGQPVLFTAIDWLNWPAVTLLLQRGADPNATDDTGMNAALRLAYLNQWGPLADMAANGADLFARDLSGLSAAQLVAGSVASQDPAFETPRRHLLALLAANPRRSDPTPHGGADRAGK